jgi:hypothetical protein
MNRFFINYCVGSRGDFLTNSLRDVEYDWELLVDLENTPKMPPPLSYCVKTHGIIEDPVFTTIEGFPKNFESWKDFFVTANSFNLIKLKIVATSIEECIDTVWFAYSKTLLNNNRLSVKLSLDDIPSPTLEYVYKNMDNIISNAFFEVASVQELDKDFQHEYDYIIKFEDLFNAEYIRDLYKKINGRDMDYERVKAIEKNIAMQYRLSKSEFYPIFKDKLSIIRALFQK